jgi:hypothetical protein
MFNIDIKIYLKNPTTIMIWWFMSRINIMVDNLEADRRPVYLEQKLGHGLIPN